MWRCPRSRSEASVGDGELGTATVVRIFSLDPDHRTMPAGAELTAVETVHDEGSFLFTATNSFDMEAEIVLVPCADDDGAVADGGTDAGEATATGGVEAWINRCTHEAQRFDTGNGVPMRDGEIICPKHGSLFDACSGECDNGEAAGTMLPDVDVTVEDGTVYLTDEEYEFVHEGGIDDSDGPSSTSHVGF
jgi:nitrite reductase/ring-hydroxylating ferredoxin subunit